MTVQEMIQSMIKQVQASLDVEHSIPQERIYLEGGLHYLSRLQALAEGSEEPKRDPAVRKAKPRSPEQKLTAREPETKIADHRIA